jgi:hypothetical protein
MSCRLYEVISERKLEDLSSQLQNLSIIQKNQILDKTFELRTIVTELNLKPAEEALYGILSFEVLQPIVELGGKIDYVPSGIRVPFSFFHGEISLHLAAFANKTRADIAAAKMDYILTRNNSTPSQIIYNLRISTRAIEDFLRNHPHTKKMGGWRDLNFIGVNKSSLHGSDIDQFDQTQRYDQHGHKCYVMCEIHNPKMTVRISDEGIVTFYSPIDTEQALRFIRDEIIAILR